MLHHRPPEGLFSSLVDTRELHLDYQSFPRLKRTERCQRGWLFRGRGWSTFLMTLRFPRIPLRFRNSSSHIWGFQKCRIYLYFIHQHEHPSLDQLGQSSSRLLCGLSVVGDRWYAYVVWIALNLVFTTFQIERMVRCWSTTVRSSSLCPFAPMTPRWIIILLLAVASLSFCTAQTCEPYNIGNLYAGICAMRFRYPIYVPAGTTQEKLYGGIFQALFGSVADPGNPLGPIPDACAAVLRQLLCASTIPGNI